jgi:hypothetical protein
MGGALLHVSLGFGPIEAWLDASMDALINFHPLHYIADFSVSVGVSFNIDILFIHIHISASVGADLHIEGPEFGGVAQFVERPLIHPFSHADLLAVLISTSSASAWTSVHRPNHHPHKTFYSSGKCYISLAPPVLVWTLQQILIPSRVN